MGSMFDWSLAGDWLGGGGLHDTHEVSQKVHRQLYTAAALGRSPGPDRKDCLRLESSDSYTHQVLELTTKANGKRLCVNSEDVEVSVYKRMRTPSGDLDHEEPDSKVLVKPTDRFTALGRTIRVPADFFLDPGDSLYLSYFIEKFSEVFSLGIMSGTRPLWNMFSRALEHLPLRYTLIAVSAWLYDGIAGRSRERSLANLRKAIPMIQNAVTSASLDDGHSFAVFLLSYMSVIRGDINGIAKHIGGFYKILRHCNVLRADGSPNPNHTSLSMVLWRIAIRMINISGFLGHRAVFPETTVDDSFHSTWLQDFDSPLRPDTTEWAIAQFALDDLANRAIHLGVRSIATQRAIAKGETDGIDELNDQIDMAFLVRDLEAWRHRPVLREAETRERERRATAPSSSPIKFLNYEPFTFADLTYATMLVQYFTVRLQLTLVVNPQIGPYPPERISYAIELCRVYAAMNGLTRPGLTGLAIGLFYAGLVLTDKTYPLEYIWIQGRLRDVDRITGYSAGAQGIRILDEIMRLNSPLPFWDYFYRVDPSQ